MNAPPAAIEFLRRHRWHARGTLLVWSLAATLADVVAFAGHWAGWWDEPVAAVFIAVGIAAALLSGWLVRASSLTRQTLARSLDRRWALQAQLESVVELAGDASAWATEQRSAAARLLAGRTPPGLIAWRTGLAAVVLALGMLTAESAAWAWHHLPARSTRVAPEIVASSPLEHGVGSIEWKSPDPEIRATAIEEVPLTAVTDSKTGFRVLRLEVMINGTQQASRALDPSVANGARQPGAHEVEPSLCLDEFQLKPFDIVAYRLVGELDVPGPGRAVRSAQQIIEIRGPRQDAASLGSGASELLVVLMQMKTRQIQLLKQNTALGQLAGAAATDPSWPTENDRVASEQRELAGLGDRALTLTAGHEVPPLVTSNLNDAKAEMLKAAAEIKARHNEAALAPQNRALALIAELDQFVERAVVNRGLTATDPIPDEQSFKLAERIHAPAGQLEQLVKRQENLNRQMASNPSVSTVDGRAAEQESIAQDTAKLAAQNAVADDVKTALDDAASAAAQAARQLQANDLETARLPAAKTERSLKEAIEAREKRGRALAVAALENARRDLNSAARAGASDRAMRLREIRQALANAAGEQQQTGSAEAARELARLVNEIGEALSPHRKAAPDNAHPANPLHDIAGDAARVQVALSQHTAALKRAVRLLAKAGQPTGASTLTSGVLADVELASQEAQWLTSDLEVANLAHTLNGAVDVSQRGAAAAPQENVPALAAELATQLEHGRRNEKDDGLVRRFNPADVDPLYRAAVENYFERLSREAHPVVHTAAASAP